MTRGGLCVCLALTVDRPADVQYNVDTETVTFARPSRRSAWCLDVRLLSASSSWSSQLHCDTVDTGSVALDDAHGVTAVEVAFCVRQRPDVCGPAQNATIGHCFIELP